MENSVEIQKAIKKYLNCDMLDSALLGNGANGKVYKCNINKEPFVIALKVTNYSDMLFKEVNTINFINERVDIKLPKIYFYQLAANEINLNIMGMSFIDGVGADRINWFCKGKKRRYFTKSAIDNFLQLQKITNDKYGVVGGEQFDNWIDYYKPFAKARLDYIIPLAKQREFPQKVVDSLTKVYDYLDDILQDGGKPVLTHGDYWAPNLLASPKTYDFVGCVDPFNLMWAESEYEIFAMILYPKLKLYKEYKNRVKTSKFVDLKSRMYSLFSEVYWFELLGKGSFGFMLWVAKKIEKEFKKFKKIKNK